MMFFFTSNVIYSLHPPPPLLVQNISLLDLIINVMTC